MHPILGDQLRLRLHLAAWSLAGGVLAVLVRVLIGVPWTSAVVFGVPLGLVAAPVSLSAWYLCRAMPLSRTSAVRIGASALGAAVITASLWAGLGRWWWQLLAATAFDLPLDRMVELFSLLLGLGALGYLLAVTVHYVLQASDESSLADRRALEAQIAQRDAELRALRAQVDPHFLFNSLNSIVGLMAVDRDQAREMCLRLAEFLRDSLTLGEEPRITLGREVALAEQYLAVERVRFGSRLSCSTGIAPDAASIAVPPLIIQPLVENAVRHGVATLVDGGAVRIEASRAGPRVLIVVTNPYDPDVAPAGDRVRHGHRAPTAGGDVRRSRGLHRRGARRPVPRRPHRAGGPDRSGGTRRTSRTSLRGCRMTLPGKVLRVVVVDDEEPARLALIQALSAIPDVALVAECRNGFEAVKVVTEMRPDAVLLDVQMPKLDGFDVLELIGADVPVIFVTAHDAFAIRAFDVHAVDYLLKPVSAERLATALKRVRERGRPAASSPAEVRASARRPGETLERVVIRDGDARACDCGGPHRLRRGAGRLRGVSHGREAAAQGADDGGRRSVAGPAPVRAHPSIVCAERGAAGAGGVVRQGQPRRDPRPTARSCP